MVKLVLPFHRNKWAVLVEPTYPNFEAETIITERRTVSADYKSLELPVGLRHYFFLNKKSSVFLNASFIFDFSIDSFIDDGFGTDLEVSSLNNLAFGLGYKYSRFSIEYRYQTPRELTSRYIYWSTDYSSSSVMLGFQLFC